LKVALDTNVLVYAEGVNGAARKREALDLIERLPAADVAVPVQTLGELFHVLTRKGGRSAAAARVSILGWRDAFPLIPTSAQAMIAAVDLAADHGLGLWDSVIVAAAAEAGCRLLLSEDMQDGFTWHGVTIANPFVPHRHQLLRSLLG
jgi:predicted nucleic acid-binding protein